MANTLHHSQIKTPCRLNSAGVHRPHAEGGPCVAMMGCAEDTEANIQNPVILCKATEHTARTHTQHLHLLGMEELVRDVQCGITFILGVCHYVGLWQNGGW